MKSWSGTLAWSSAARWLCSSAALLMMEASFLKVRVNQTLLERTWSATWAVKKTGQAGFLLEIGRE